MSGVPKSLRDFKKANNNNMQNTILNAKNSKQSNFSIDDVMQPQQGQPMQPQMGGLLDNPYQEQFRQPDFASQPEFMGQGDFPQSLKPNFNEAYSQANVSDIVMQDVQKDNTSNQTMGEMDNVANMQMPQIPPMQPSMPQGNMNMQNIPVETPTNDVFGQNVATMKEETKERKVERKVPEDLKVQPYQQVQMTPIQERKTNNKNIVAHVQEIETEIDALVNNTEAFLNNTKVLKIQILQAKNKEELKVVMDNVQETLKEIPESFIDAETRRRLRLCFSYLHKTKKELLEMEDKLKETQDSLSHLVSIDDINELEEVILDIPATPTTDNVYEIRTFEINLINQLPVIKDELLRERISAVYNY